LNLTGRYAHSSGYLTKLAAANGFRIQQMICTRARLEDGKPVQAWLALWEN